ncbi:MAG: polysaccharide biosynthesis/export family protein [Puniceicoccales bacterium]|jgi:polysaccharide export outer membrane protein|nr:polysaccharide biosynthesis/export family protein [Puniceicoccales bacterium]
MKNVFRVLPVLLTGLACGFLCGCVDEPTEYPPPLPQSGLENYKLRPMDTIVVEFFQESTPPSELRVSADGDVNLYLIDRVKVVGLNIHQVKERLIERYKEFYTNPSLTVRISNYAPQRVHIDGFVGRPGPVLFFPEQGLTLARAITEAGGVQPRGDRRGVLLTRIINGMARTFRINLNEIQDEGNPDIPLAEGDLIYVREGLI